MVSAVDILLTMPSDQQSSGQRCPGHRIQYVTEMSSVDITYRCPLSVDDLYPQSMFRRVVVPSTTGASTDMDVPSM